MQKKSDLGKGKRTHTKPNEGQETRARKEEKRGEQLKKLETRKDNMNMEQKQGLRLRRIVYNDKEEDMMKRGKSHTNT